MTSNTWNPEGLRKSGRDVWLFGICGGLGEHTPLPGWMWRAIFVATALMGSILLYVALWLFMPAARHGPPDAGEHGGEGDGHPRP